MLAHRRENSVTRVIGEQNLPRAIEWAKTVKISLADAKYFG